jgi:biopolymer transport protein TolR
MARTFRRKHTAQPIAELNVTNMIDLGFTLLIIFMITTSYSQQEQSTPINLPTVAKSPQQKVDKDDKFVAVGVDASGNYFIDNSTTAVSITELRRRLQAYAAQPKQPVIRVRGDGEAFYKKVATVFNEVEKAGLTRVTIDYAVKE